MVSPTQLCWRYHSLPLSQQLDLIINETFEAYIFLSLCMRDIRVLIVASPNWPSMRWSCLPWEYKNLRSVFFIIFNYLLNFYISAYFSLTDRSKDDVIMPNVAPVTGDKGNPYYSAELEGKTYKPGLFVKLKHLLKFCISYHYCVFAKYMPTNVIIILLYVHLGFFNP